MPHRWQVVAAPKIFCGPEHSIDVVDKQGILFFDQSVRIRNRMLSASFLAHTDRICSPISVRMSLCACSRRLSPRLPLQHSDEMTFTVCGALLSRDPVE